MAKIRAGVIAVDYAGALPARLRVADEQPHSSRAFLAATMKQIEDVAPTFTIDPCCDGRSCQEEFWQGRRWSLQKHKLVDSVQLCWRALLGLSFTGGQASRVKDSGRQQTQESGQDT